MMKKLIVVIFLYLPGSFCAQAGGKSDISTQPQDPAQVPSLVKEAFTREHPQSHGTWSKEGENHKVEFVDKESRLGHVIVYDRTGKVIRRDSELESVPGPINDYYNKNYPGETFKTWSAEAEKEKYYYSNRKSEQ